MSVTLTKYPTPLLNKIGSYVCQAVIYIQQQQPALLLDRYRSISWRENSNQLRLKAKLIGVISNAQDWESLVNHVEVFIKALLIPNSTNTPVLIKLQEKIRQLNPNISESKTSSNLQDINTDNKSNTQTVDTRVSNHQKFHIKTTELSDSDNQQGPKFTESIKQESLPKTTESKTDKNQLDISSIDKKAPAQAEIQNQAGIAVLLLDAENIKIPPETEKFLTTVCTNPIKIKIAFANWQSMGEKDIEFYDRGYDLIHVPSGKDNADKKMIAFGSIIDEYYPKVKEVLVCSSHNVMKNLCKHLQKKGLTVYHVSQENSNLTILNSQTDETQIHTILPSIEQLIFQIKDIVKEQEVQTLNQWIKLSKICRLFKEKYSFGINKVVSHYLPGKNVKNIFVNQPEFVIHQIPEHPEAYVTLFKMPTEKNVDNKLLTFENESALEQAVVKIITHLIGKTPNNYIPIHAVGERFDKKYGKAITKILKQLNMSGNFVNFLKSCSSFDLKKTGNIWQVALK